MISKWKKLFPFFKKLHQLEEENKLLKEKLQEKQAVINKTNAFWKKKLHSRQQGNRV